MSWSRLEGATVGADLTAGLEARIADPLWMLARQWQVGEFGGEDAARPVEIRAQASWQPLGEVRLGDRNGIERIDPGGAPLEALVEAEPALTGAAALRLAAEAGLHLLRLARAERTDADLLGRLQADHAIVLPADDGLDPSGRAELELLAARSFDGASLARALAAGAKPDPAIAAVVDAWRATLDPRLTAAPGGPPAWEPERLEYRFTVAAPAFQRGTPLEAAGHAGGTLDWHAFDVARGASPALAEDAPGREIVTAPVPLAYAGMPAPRWWAFEDGAVYWGGVEGGLEDLARYLVAAFATVAGDDWHVVGIDVPRGVLAQARSVEVLDSFGRTHPIPATAARDHARAKDGRAWRVFELTGDPAPAAGNAPHLLVPAVLAPHDEGPPEEEVLFLRDEGANLAWAVERTVLAASGRAAFRAREATAPQRRPKRDIWDYTLQTPVPPHYIPLVPVRTDGERPAIRLQRGRMAGAAGARGELLEPDRPLLLHEEEIPVSGVRVTRTHQLARDPNGGVHLWLGRTKRPGRGPAKTGLAHDVVTIAEAQP